MKKFIVLSIVLLMLAGFAITSSAAEPIPIDTVALLAGQTIVVGELFVGIESGTYLVVRYDTNPTICEWELLETHLYVGTETPKKSAPGRFPYGPEYMNMVITEGCFVEYFIPLTDFMTNSILPGTLYIAAHAEVGMIDEFGDPICYEGTDVQIEETIWADGIRIRPGKNWAMYFTVEVPEED